MTLFLRDRENFRMGGYTTKVGQIRHNMKTQPVSAMASFIVLPEDTCKEVIKIIEAHPDWDDEQLAEEVDWA